MSIITIVHKIFIIDVCIHFLVLKIKTNNVTVFENDREVSIQVERSEGLHRSIIMNVITVDGTALG